MTNINRQDADGVDLAMLDAETRKVITLEMMRAGIDAYVQFNPQEESLEEALARVYLAMRKADR